MNESGGSISIVPVLSRTVEREIVQSHIYIYVLQQVNDLLFANVYVTLIALDFSKAVDTVRKSLNSTRQNLSAVSKRANLISFLRNTRHFNWLTD